MSSILQPSDEAMFKKQFVVNFLSSYCAVNNNEFCQTDKHDLLKHPPVEDAEFLAHTAWQHYVETVGFNDTLTERLAKDE